MLNRLWDCKYNEKQHAHTRAIYVLLSITPIGLIFLEARAQDIIILVSMIYRLAMINQMGTFKIILIIPSLL